MRWLHHVPRALGAGVVVLLLLQAVTARAEDALGVQLPARSRQLSDGRFELKGTYEAMVSFFSKQFAKAGARVAASERVHRVGVKYTHFESLDASTRWEHVNVATYGGTVYVLILPRGRP